MDEENPVNFNQTPYFKQQSHEEEEEEKMDVKELFSPSPAKETIQEDFLEPAVRARLNQLLQNVRVFHNFETLEEIYMTAEF